MSLSREERDEIRKRLNSFNFKSREERIAEGKWLLAQIPKLLEDCESAQHHFRVETVPGPGRQLRLYAETDEMAELFCEMCRTYGTVTWKLHQDLTKDKDDNFKTLQPGGGTYMLSESLHPDHLPRVSQPKALPKEEPDGMNPDV